MLVSLEDVATGEVGNDRLAGHAGCEDQLFGPQGDLLAGAVEHNGPFALLFVVGRAFRFGRTPIVEFHHLGVHFQPVADLVLGREYRPVRRERQIGHVIVPDRVMQAERLVALAPAVAGTLVLLDDDGWHAELLQARAEPDGALAAADDEAIGLPRTAEFGGLRLAILLPRPALLLGAVGNAERACGTERLFMALELDHGGEQGPDQAVLQPYVAEASCCPGFEGEPAFKQTILFGGILARRDSPAGRFGGVELAFQHAPDVVLAFECLDVPCERHEVAPITIVLKQAQHRVDVARRKRAAEAVKEFGQLSVRGLFEHVSSKALDIARFPAPPGQRAPGQYRQRLSSAPDRC